MEWLKGKTEAQFTEQFVDAFSEADHPLAKMPKPERIKWLKDAFVALSGLVKRGGTQ